MKLRGLTLGLLLAFVGMAGTLVPVQSAAASTKGRKLTTEVLGGLAAEQLLTGKTRNGLLLGAGAAYAYKRYRDAVKNDRKRESALYHNYYHRRYGAASVTRTRRTHKVVRRYQRVRAATWLTFTGRVTDTAGVADRNISVISNGVSRRVVVPDSADVSLGGSDLSVHDLQRGDIVQVRARHMNGDRWRADQVMVLHPGRFGGASDVTTTTTTTVVTTDRAIFTGHVTDPAGDADRNISVRANGISHRIEVPGGARVSLGASGLSVHDLRRGDYVRVMAVRIGPDRWRAQAVRVLSPVQ